MDTRRVLAVAALLVHVAFLGRIAAQSGVAEAQQKARVFVYRYKQFVGKALEPSVYCDEIEIARMDNGRFFVVELAPGKHVFRSNDKQSGVELEVKSGQSYYVRVEIATGFWKGHGRLVETAAEQGAYEIKQLKALDADKIGDKTLVIDSTHTEPAQKELSRTRDLLTNKDVIALKEGGLSDETIIAKIRSSATSFSLATQELIQLRKSNVSDAVIQVMIELTKHD